MRHCFLKKINKRQTHLINKLLKVQQNGGVNVSVMLICFSNIMEFKLDKLCEIDNLCAHCLSYNIFENNKLRTKRDGG